ncbi:glycosyltransferase [Actinomadura keratinilytica]|uniref:glycosyltransferase n=1 Tax=Actinomadura keratinilytica TaxID=547461 RepID=UPI0031EE2A44
MRARRVRVPPLGAVTAPTPGMPSTRRKAKASRFLFAVPPLTGHITPTVAVAAELTRRAHRVAWVGPRAAVEPLVPRNARVYPAGDEVAAPRSDLPDEPHIPSALRSLWEDLIVPLGHAMMPGVETAIDRFRPDVVVSDQQVLAAPVAARLRGLPWATSAATPFEFARPLRDAPDEEERIRELIGDFQLDHGIEDLLDPRFSDHLVLVFATGALIGDTSVFPDRFAFVGPVPPRPRGGDFPWEWLDGRPAVLVTPGAGAGAGHDAAAARFLRVAAEDVAALTVRAVFAAPPDAVPEPPPNALVRPDVPQPALLERMAAGRAAVVCPGGHDAVCAGLAHGLPLVVAPIRHDQPVIARLVAEAGAGIAVGFGRAAPVELRAALGAVLTDDAHRAAAVRIQDSFAAAGGAAAAADRLEKLA